MKIKKQILTILLLGCVLTGCDAQRREFVFSAGEASAVTEIPDVSGPSDSGAAQSQEDQTDTIYVDVCGAVVSPGVYELQAGSRAYEAIAMAGGLTKEASGVSVNQAQPLTDGQQLYIPAVNGPGETGEEPAAFRAAQQGVSPQNSDKVNINTADKQTLMTLNGIGEVRAQAILSYREEHGGFLTVEDLLQVPGIKEGTLAKIKDRIVTG